MEPIQSIYYRAFKRYTSEKGILLSESQMNIAAHILDLNLSNPDPIDDTLINSVREFIVDRHEHLDTLIGYGKKLDEVTMRIASVMCVSTDEERSAWIAEFDTPEIREMKRLYHEE